MSNLESTSYIHNEQLSIPVEEKVKSALHNEYEYEFNEYFGIFDMVKPESLKYSNIEMFYNNSNVIVLIIEPMCVGILFTAHIAMKFKYIENCINYGDYGYIYENGMKIVKVKSEWNTSKWSYTKLLKFYNHLDLFEQMSVSEIEIKILNCKHTRKSYPYCDIEFLDSLCWDGDVFDV